jgi:hypothetical protein
MTTANPQRGEVEVKLGGKTRILVLNFRALAQAETIGKFNIFALKSNDIGMNEFRALGYAGLLKHDPRLTLEQFDELIDSEEALKDLMAAVLAAMGGSFGVSKKLDEAANPQTPAKAAPGHSS